MTQIRWEVIADFPASVYRVGDVITTNDKCIAWVVQLNDTYASIDGDYNLSDYPHLFKRLD